MKDERLGKKLVFFPGVYRKARESNKRKLVSEQIRFRAQTEKYSSTYESA